MKSGFRDRWMHYLLHRSHLHVIVEKYHLELKQHEEATRTLRSWKALLLACRTHWIYPILVAVLAVISAGTGLYPFSPVLIAAIVFAPFRWRSVYLGAALGAATGAGLLAIILQGVGSHALPGFMAEWVNSVEGSYVQRWIETHGTYALAVIAALPVPEMPALLTLILAATPPGLIWLAIFAGKLVKYGVYVLCVLLVLRAVKKKLAHSQSSG